MDQVQKYVASEDKSPKLNKLAAQNGKTKAKVQQSVEDIADELIALYKEREMSVGYQYGEDTAEQHDFEMDFPYELTQTKLNLLKKLKNMEKNVQWMLAMWRCGLRKTEVAVRAAFKAVMEGKQVAF